MKKIINCPVNNVLTSEYIGRITSIRDFNEALELCAKHKDTDIVYKRIDSADAYVYSVSDATPNKACLRIAKWLCKEECVYTSDFIINGNNLEFSVYNGDNKMVPDPITALRSITKLFERIMKKRGVNAVILRSEESDIPDDVYAWQVCVNMDNKTME